MSEVMARLSRRAWIGAAVALLVVIVAIVALTHAGGKGQTTTPATAQQCGSVLNQLAVSTDPAVAAKAEQCFATAFKACKPATLVYTSSGVDAGATNTLSVTQKGSGCVITDIVQSDVNTTQRNFTDTCTGAVQQSDGLHLSGCATLGDLVVASRGQQQ